MPIKRILIFFTITVLSLNGVFAQNRTLTLEDAVLKQRTELSPKQLRGLQWIPNEDAYSFREKDNLMVVSATAEGSKKITLSELNEAIQAAVGTSVKAFPSCKWLNKNEFYFKVKQNFLLYEVEARRAKVIGKLPEGAVNLDLEGTSKSLAFVKDHNLFVTTPAGANIQVSKDGNREVTYGEAVHRYEFGISKGIFWSPKGNLLAFYRNDQHKVTDYPLVLNMETPAQLKLIKYPMAGATNESVSIGVFNMQSKTTVYLKTDKAFEYLTNVTWSPTEEYLFVACLNRDQKHMKLNKYDARTGEFISTLFEEKKETYVEPLHPLYFIPGKNNEFVWMSNRDGFLQAYRYNDEGKLLKKLSLNNFHISSIHGFNTNGKLLFVQGTGSNPTESHLFQIKVDKGGMKKVTSTAGVHRSQVSSSGRFALDAYSNLETPGITQLIDISGKQANKNLLKSESPLKDYNLPKAEIFTIEGSAGVKLYARMIKPTNFDEKKKYPVVVYVYNGPHVQLIRNKWLGGANLWMYHLAQKGYIVFTIDGRGSANRGAAFEEVIHRNLGTVELEDQLMGVKYLKSMDFVDAERMAVHGWSYGGFMTTSLMLKHPEVFKVGVAGGPVIDWKFYEIMYTERYMDTPEQNPEGYAAARLHDKVSNLKGKLLLIHGLMDDVVVPQHNFYILRKAVEEGVQLDFFPYPTHPHNVRGKDRVHLMRKVLQYIETNL